MTDIVERLLAYLGPTDLKELIRVMVEQRHEAAAEIKRLRNDIAVERDAWAKDCDEVERLTQLLKMSSDAGFDLAKDVAEKHMAEIERLRLRIKDLEINSPAQTALDEIERLTAAVQQHEIWQESLVKQLVDKDAEIERLTAHHNATMCMLHTDCADGCKHAEIERLRRDNEHLRHNAICVMKTVEEQQAEIERLNEQLRAVLKHVEDLRNTVNNQAETIVHAEKLVHESGLRLGQAHAEIAQLRAEAIKAPTSPDTKEKPRR